MAATNAPTQIDLCRRRGDTKSFTTTIRDGAGAVIDITGRSYLLTVDPAPDPTGPGNNLFQLTGVLSDPVNGVVTWGPLSGPEADQAPNTYFYDMQETDTAGEILTVLFGQWQVVQDITK